MAISRHSDEWKRTIFCALMAGVTFEQRECAGPLWIARAGEMRFTAPTKYGAALDALRYIEGLFDPPPDAATKPAGRSPGTELRSSQ